MADEGKIVSGYQGRSCANAPCRVPLTAETEAFLHTNRETGKLLLLCGACSLHARLNDSLRFPLVPL